MLCKNCHREIEDNSDFCRYCGNSQKDNISRNAPTAFCRSCGAAIGGYDEYCAKCGAFQGPAAPRPVNSPYNQSYASNISPKNKWIALLLCLFGGFLGLHRFYVGKIGSGIAYIFTWGLLYIGAIVDCVMILCDKFTDADGLLVVRDKF